MKKISIFFVLLMLIIVYQSSCFKIEAEETINLTEPFSFTEDIFFSKIDFGANHSVALTKDGRIFTWGFNNYGQLGDNTLVNKNYPTDVTGFANLNIDEIFIDISVGSDHNIALTSHGRVFTWGYNYFGQIGNGTANNFIVTPIDITSYLELQPEETIIKISAGSNHSGALTSKARLFLWGANYSGQIGMGTTTSMYIVPSEINQNFDLNENDEIVFFDLGKDYSAVYTKMNRVFLWGYNYYGQLGDGTTTDSIIPTEITNQFSFSIEERIQFFQISDRPYSSSAIITSLGKIYNWGYDVFDLSSTISNQNNNPIEISSYFDFSENSNPIQVALGFEKSLILNSFGEIYNTENIDFYSEINFQPNEIIVQASYGDSHAGVITSSGRLFTWGYSTYGALGLGLSTRAWDPTEVISNFNIKRNFISENEVIIDFVSDFNKSIILSSDNKVYTVGNGLYGQLGTGDYKSYVVPQNITDLFYLVDEEVIINIAAGGRHSLALTSSGNVFSWGSNDYGALGNDNSGISSVAYIPAKITDYFTLNETEKIIAIDAQTFSSIVLSSEGRVFTWGYNVFGQLGDGTTEDKSLPLEITSQFNLAANETIVSVSRGGFHSLAITSEGRVFTWGYNSNGQLGDGTTENKSVPTEITSSLSLGVNETIMSVSLGDSHSSALTSTGRVLTWGLNNYGQLGDSTTTNRTTPTEITSQFNLLAEEIITSISLGQSHSLATTSSGRVFAWGNNEYRQLGDGTLVGQNAPIEITDQFLLESGDKVVKAKAENHSSMVITEQGQVLVWGYNYYGQLGTGIISDVVTPITINKIDYSYYNISLTTTKFQENYLKDTLTLTFVPEFEITKDISSININGIEYSDFVIDKGVIAVNIPNVWNINEKIDFVIQSITLTDNQIINLTGNTSCSTSLINDIFSPTIIFENEYELYIDQTSDVNKYLLAFSIDETGQEYPMEITHNILEGIPGEYLVIYKSSDDHNNETTRTRKIVVMPEISENITFDGMTFYNFEDQNYISDLDFTKQYVCYENLCPRKINDTDSIVYNQLRNHVDLVFVSLDRMIIVNKTIIVNPKLNPSLDSIETGSNYSDYGIDIGDVNGDITITGEVDTTTPGVYILTYEVTDTLGNKTIVLRYVTVYEKEVEVEFKLGNANTTINVGEEYVDGTCFISINGTDYECIVKENTVNTNLPGVYFITYSYTYQDKEYTYKRYVFVVREKEPLILYSPYRKEEGDQL